MLNLKVMYEYKALTCYVLMWSSLHRVSIALLERLLLMKGKS